MRGGGPHTKQTKLSMGQTPLSMGEMSPPKSKGRSKSMKRTTVRTPKVNKFLLAFQQEHEKKEARQHLRYLDQWINIVNSSGLLKHAKPHLPTYKVDKYSLEFIKNPRTGEREEYTLAEVEELAEQQKDKPYLHGPRKSYYSKEFNEPRSKSPNFLANVPPLR
jgi:hypothetical protein